MQPVSPLMWTLLAALVLLVVGLALALWATQREAGRRSRARNARAQAGEHAAEALLAQHGFAVVARQVPVDGTLWVDGQAETFGVRLDLVVERGGRRFAAEVKTGDNAPDPAWPATRRQLREYAALCPDMGVLLVDVDAGAVYDVGFDSS